MKKPTKIQAPEDENLVLPAAVRAAANRANEIVTELYPADPDGATPEENLAPLSPEQTFANVPAATALETPAQGAPAGGAAPTDPNESGQDDWEHKYRSAQGRLDRTLAQVNQLTDRLGEMERLLAAGAHPPAQAVAPPAPQRLLTPEEESEYGEEFLSVVGKRAREEMFGELAQRDARLQDMERRLQGVSNVTSLSGRERMEQTLDAKVPNWRDVNFDENFLAWLRLPDHYSGVIRHELLKRAFENNETSRVLAFFNGFLSEEAAVAPQGAPPDPTLTVTPEGKVPLETLAAPGRAKTAAATPPAPAEKPILKSADVTRFYTEVAAGKYRGRDEEKARIESTIFEAGRDGRIR